MVSGYIFLSFQLVANFLFFYEKESLQFAVSLSDSSIHRHCCHFCLPFYSSSSFNLDKMFLLSHRNRKYNENCVVLFYADEMGKR